MFLSLAVLPQCFQRAAAVVSILPPCLTVLESIGTRVSRQSPYLNGRGSCHHAFSRKKRLVGTFTIDRVLSAAQRDRGHTMQSAFTFELEF